MSLDPFYSITLKTDTDGSGDGTDARIAQGFVEAIKVDFAAGTDAGADTTLVDHLGRTLVTITNSKTDIWIYPRLEETSNAGVGLGTYTRPLVNGGLTLTIAQGGATVTDAVTLTVQLSTR